MKLARRARLSSDTALTDRLTGSIDAAHCMVLQFSKASVDHCLRCCVHACSVTTSVMTTAGEQQRQLKHDGG